MGLGEPFDMLHIFVDPTAIQSKNQSVLKRFDEFPGVVRVSLQSIKATASGKVAVKIGVVTQKFHDSAGRIYRSFWIGIDDLAEGFVTDMAPEALAMAKKY